MIRQLAPALIAALTILACGGEPAAEAAPTLTRDPGVTVVVRDTMLPEVIEAPAVAEPVVQSTLATKLISRVTAVHVREGDRVAAGAVLVQLDDRDLAAKREQADAGLKSAEAAHREAELQAGRLRALFADSAAPRAHLDAAEAGLQRAAQGVRAARAAMMELDALADYATIRAPFAGLVSQRFVDVGAFAAPGSPLVRLEDTRRLRLVAAVVPDVAALVRRGEELVVTIEGVASRGIIEGVVPEGGAALSKVQVLVDNPDGRFSSGSAATVRITGPMRHAVVVPERAIVRSGDLTGVRVATASGEVTRWVRLGARHGDLVEVLAGLTPGETVLADGDTPGGA